MSDDSENVFEARQTVRIPEIAEATGLDEEEVREVLYGGAYYMDAKEKVEEYLGWDMVDVELLVGIQ